MWLEGLRDLFCLSLPLPLLVIVSMGIIGALFQGRNKLHGVSKELTLSQPLLFFFILCCIYFARELDLHDHVILQALVAEPQNIHTHFQSRISWTCLFQPFIVRMIISFFEKDILGTYMADDA